MKYKGHKEIGFELGRWLGIDLRDSEGYAGVNCIIPVPLHPKKEKKRGYNQSEWIARGIGRGMELPVETGNLVRIQDSATQTRKSRIERWENVEKIFSVLDPGKINGRHVLLVDDVVTTGATLEACASTLLEAGVSRVSIATLAVA
jgi:ComF family protein